MIAIILSWFQPSNSLFSVALSSATPRRTSENSGTLARARLSGTDMAYLPSRLTAEPASLRTSWLLPDTQAVHQEWRKLLVTQHVSGVQVHDARLVAAMRVHAVKRILTFNEKDFARYTEIEAIHPRTLAEKHP